MLVIIHSYIGVLQLFKDTNLEFQIFLQYVRTSNKVDYVN